MKPPDICIHHTAALKILVAIIREADIILVMKDGKIIEQGNHESLLAADGFYANLYNSQFA